MAQPQADPLAPAAAPVVPEGLDQTAAATDPNAQPATPPSSDSAPEQAPEPDYFRAAFNNMRRQQYGSPEPSETPPASEHQPSPETAVFGDTTSTAQETEPASQPESQPRRSAAPKSRTFTEEEWARSVQSEVDRRLDKHNREEAARRQREQEQRAREQERQLRDSDPYEYARLMKEREEEQAQNQRRLEEIRGFAVEQVTTYDRQVLDPLILEVPAEDRQAILAQTEPGVEGRGKITKAALSALKKHYVNQGRQSARQALANDQTFIKEILARYGGGIPEPISAPAVPSSQPGTNGENMNDVLRMAAAATRRR